MRAVESEYQRVNGRLVDGMEFCKTVFWIFDAIRKSPGGNLRLRHIKGRIEKKLVEELLPIAKYLQINYNHARRIKVRWTDGNQPYDAYLLSSGAYVEKKIAPKKQHVEVTCALHENDHWAKIYLTENGFSYGPKGTYLDKSIRKIVSTPHVNHGNEAQDEFATIVLNRIKAKDEIVYPKDTTLIVQCMLHSLFYEEDWEYMIGKIRQEVGAHNFREIFIYDQMWNRFSTLKIDAKKTMRSGN